MHVSCCAPPPPPGSPVVPPGRAPLVEVPPPLAALDTPCHRAVVRAYRAAVQVGPWATEGWRRSCRCCRCRLTSVPFVIVVR